MATSALYNDCPQLREVQDKPDSEFKCCHCGEPVEPPTDLLSRLDATIGISCDDCQDFPMPMVAENGPAHFDAIFVPPTIMGRV